MATRGQKRLREYFMTEEIGLENIGAQENVENQENINNERNDGASGKLT